MLLHANMIGMMMFKLTAASNLALVTSERYMQSELF